MFDIYILKQFCDHYCTASKTGCTAHVQVCLCGDKVGKTATASKTTHCNTFTSFKTLHHCPEAFVAR